MTKQHAIFVGDPGHLLDFQINRLAVDRAFGTPNAVELDTFYIKAFHALDHEDGLVMDHATFWRHDREDGIYLAHTPDPEND